MNLHDNRLQRWQSFVISVLIMTGLLVALATAQLEEKGQGARHHTRQKKGMTRDSKTLVLSSNYYYQTNAHSFDDNYRSGDTIMMANNPVHGVMNKEIVTIGGKCGDQGLTIMSDKNRTGLLQLINGTKIEDKVSQQQMKTHSHPRHRRNIYYEGQSPCSNTSSHLTLIQLCVQVNTTQGFKISYNNLKYRGRPITELTYPGHYKVYAMAGQKDNSWGNVFAYSGTDWTPKPTTTYAKKWSGQIFFNFIKRFTCNNSKHDTKGKYNRLCIG